MRGFPGSFSSMNWIVVCHLAGEKPCWNGSVLALAKIGERPLSEDRSL